MINASTRSVSCRESFGEAIMKVVGVYKKAKPSFDSALIVEFLGGDLTVHVDNSSKPIPYRVVRISDSVVTRTGSLINGHSTVVTPNSITEKYRLELLGALTPSIPASSSGVSFVSNNKILNILHIDDDLYGFNNYPQTQSSALIDVPANLPPSITSLDYAFFNCVVFNSPIVSDWDMSKVTSMAGMLYYASTFNQPLNNWDVSSVTNMSYMFYYASAFNQPLNNWDVSKVTSMVQMFGYASAFNQPLNNWDVSNVGDWYSFRTDSPLSTDNTPPRFR